jgi:hypothetical protein
MCLEDSPAQGVARLGLMCCQLMQTLAARATRHATRPCRSESSNDHRAICFLTDNKMNDPSRLTLALISSTEYSTVICIHG